MVRPRPARPRRAEAGGSACRARGSARARRCRRSCSEPSPCARRSRSRAVEDALDRRGHRVAGRDQADVAAEDALKERAHERIVRAAEDHGVHVSAVKRRAVGADGVDDGLGEGKAALDDRREVGRRDLGDGQLAVLARERAQVGAAFDGRERREDAHAPRVGDRGGDLGLGLDHGDDLHARSAARLARGVEPGARGGVAGDHDQLRAALEQEARVPLDAFREVVQAARAVGEAGVVAEVEVVLLGQRDEAARGGP